MRATAVLQSDTLCSIFHSCDSLLSKTPSPSPPTPPSLSVSLSFSFSIPMASKFPTLLLLFTTLLFLSSTSAHLTVDTSLKLMADALEWPTTISLVDDTAAPDDDEDEDPRRSLFWRRVHYYISYGALAANRIPCPPRSGRPYYTHNCYRARGPVNPYSRGCSAITRCRR